MPCTKKDCPKCLSDGFAPEIKKFWTVWNPERALPKMRHKTLHDALNESHRLSHKHPGQTFLVMEAVASDFIESTGIKKPAGDAPYGDGARNEETAEIRVGDQEWIKKDGDNECWIDWYGGERPVSPDTHIIAVFRNGVKTKPTTAGQVTWLGSGKGCEVRRFKVVPAPDDFAPCPMPGCREKAKLYESSHDYGTHYNIECLNEKCGIGTPPMDTREEAVAIWNNRNETRPATEAESLVLRKAAIGSAEILDAGYLYDKTGGSPFSSDENPAPDEHGWIPHVPGEPMPCGPEVVVNFRVRYGFESLGTAKDLAWERLPGFTCSQQEIIAWRPTKQEQPKPERKSHEALEAEISRLNAELHKSEVENDSLHKKICNSYKKLKFHKSRADEAYQAYQQGFFILEKERDAWREKAEAAGKMGVEIAERNKELMEQIDALVESTQDLSESLEESEKLNWHKDDQIALMAEGFAAFKGEAIVLVKSLSAPLRCVDHPHGRAATDFIKKHGADA